tara:strand:- start:1556 stop:1930 length:375 start_codon:yes stop_codon:yes gene_type:complete
MFDMSFLEILIVAIVSLLVLGPDRLPGAVRTGVLYVGRIKRYVNRLRSEIETEIGANEIRSAIVDDSTSKIEADLAEMKKSYYKASDYIAAGSSSVHTNSPESKSFDENVDLRRNEDKVGVPEL